MLTKIFQAFKMSNYNINQPDQLTDFFVSLMRSPTKQSEPIPYCTFINDMSLFRGQGTADSLTDIVNAYIDYPDQPNHYIKAALQIIADPSISNYDVTSNPDIQNLAAQIYQNLPINSDQINKLATLMNNECPITH
jgi:hypothetical protein